MLISKCPNTTTAAASALLIGFFSLSVHAATITVTTLSDSGPGSLRDAIELATAGDIIDFRGGLSGTILLGSTLILDKSLTILGNPGIVLDGNDLVRPVSVSSAQQVSLRELIIQRGAAGDGAGILSSGTLALTDVVLRDNHASDRGGALFVNVGSYALLRVEFSDNSAVADGGALMDVGTGASSIANSRLTNNVSNGAGGAIRHASMQTLNISNSVISGNAVTRLSGAAQGGGISSQAGVLRVTGSTVSGNKAFFGGGIMLQGVGAVSDLARLDLSESAVINNSAQSVGGGLYVLGATLNSTNSTISNNLAGLSLGGGIVMENRSTEDARASLINNTIAFNRAGLAGGGIAVVSGKLSLKNSVIAGNSAASNAAGSNPDLLGTFLSLSFNLVGTRGTSTGYINSDLPDGTLPQLGTLRFNGGLSLSIAPQAGSPLINAISFQNCAGITRDQRRYSRPAGNCDIGALEVEGVAPPGVLFADGFE